MVSTSQFTVCFSPCPRFNSFNLISNDDYLGSAPDISGKGIVNPIGTILSVAMMLKYSLNLPVEAKAVEEAVRRTIENGVRTGDIGGSNKTVEVGDAVAEELKKVLKEL